VTHIVLYILNSYNKKRKGVSKDANKNLKKLKTGKGDGLTLNAPAKCVEILHIKVMHML